MTNNEIEILVKIFCDTFGYNNISFVNVTGKSMITGYDNYFDIIFYKTTSYTYPKFSYLYRKYLKEISEKINTNIHKSKEYKGFYYWSPSYSLKFGEYKMEFGRRSWDKHHLNDGSTEFYFTTNNKFFIDQVCNYILNYKPLKIKRNSIYE